MIFGAIVAGGVGSRMKSALPKQFLPLNGCPIIIYSVRRFLACSKIDRLFIGVHPDYIEYTSRLLCEHNCNDARVQTVAAGECRNETIMNIVTAISRSTPLHGSYIITHDAVRPFVTDDMISANIDAVLRHGAVDTAAPVTDTVVRSDDGLFISDIPDRSVLFAGQTPQSFDAELFAGYYRRLTAAQVTAMTDGCSIFRAFGHPVYIVPGDARNIKITTRTDLALASLLQKQSDD